MFSMQNHVPKHWFAGYVILAPKPRGLLESTGNRPCLGYRKRTYFLQAVVEKEARVCVFDVIFTRPLPEGLERCPVEGGRGEVNLPLKKI